MWQMPSSMGTVGIQDRLWVLESTRPSNGVFEERRNWVIEGKAGMDSRSISKKIPTGSRNLPDWGGKKGRSI